MSSTNGENDIVLLFHHSVLRRRDVDLLQPCCWLNDNILTFCMEYYTNVVFADREADIAFVDPSVAHLLKLSGEEEVLSLSQSLKWEKKELIILPLNDCMSASGGGLHWSLLVYRVRTKKFEYYDSMCKSSYVPKNVRTMAKNVLVAVTGKNVTVDKHNIDIQVIPCAQQTNCSDCGVYVLCFAELVAADFCKPNPSLCEEVKSISADSVAARRVKLLDTITELKTASGDSQTSVIA